MISHMMDVMKNLMTGEQLQNETKNVEDKMKKSVFASFQRKGDTIYFCNDIIAFEDTTSKNKDNDAYPTGS